MRILKASTKAGQRVIAMYKRNDGYQLSDCYGKYSARKQAAYDSCLRAFQSDNKATNFHIGSHGCQTFTVAWKYVDENTGHEMVRVETAENTYRVDLEA